MLCRHQQVSRALRLLLHCELQLIYFLQILLLIRVSITLNHDIESCSLLFGHIDLETIFGISIIARFNRPTVLVFLIVVLPEISATTHLPDHTCASR